MSSALSASRSIGFFPGLGLAVFAGGALGLSLAQGPSATDPALLTLLRFMAVMKGGLALGAAWALMGRWRRPMQNPARGAYLIGLAALIAGPPPIWAGTHVLAGAVLVHAGLALLAVTAWRDRAAWRPILKL